MFAEIRQFVNWARRRNPAAHTWRDYRCDLEQFAGAAGEKLLAEVTYKDVDRIVKAQVDRGLKPAASRPARPVSLSGSHEPGRPGYAGHPGPPLPAPRPAPATRCSRPGH